jgi:hypothetical protein
MAKISDGTRFSEKDLQGILCQPSLKNFDYGLPIQINMFTKENISKITTP